MGQRNGPYREDFPAGSSVRIADRAELERFSRVWRLHHPLEAGQLVYADEVAEVETVDFYHGGDELYRLRGIPGIWHETCLHPATRRGPSDPPLRPPGCAGGRGSALSELTPTDALVNGIEIRDGSENGALAFDLVDLLRVVGQAAQLSTWRWDGVEATGAEADWLHGASDRNVLVPGTELASRSEGVRQVIDGRFRAFRPGSSAPWLELRAVDSTLWEVHSDDQELLDRMRTQFKAVRLINRVG